MMLAKVQINYELSQSAHQAGVFQIIANPAYHDAFCK